MKTLADPSGCLVRSLVAAAALALIGCGSSSGGAGPDGAVPDGVIPIACAAPTGGPTMHTANLTASETWTAAASPHIVTSLLQLRNTTVLTIEPCAEVRFGSQAGLFVGPGGAASRLVARGDASHPIRMVADGQAIWSNLTVLDPGRIELAYVTFSGGGSDGGARFGATLVGRGAGALPLQPVIYAYQVRIERSAGVGVFIDGMGGFAQGSTDLTVTQSGDATNPYPVRLLAQEVGTLPSGVYTGNLTDEILVEYTGEVTEDVTVHDRGVPYHFGAEPQGRLAVFGPDANTVTTMTVEPGVTIKVAQNTRIAVGEGSDSGLTNAGALQAVGTAQKPIVFTSGAATPAPGDWIGLSFEGGTGMIDHARIEYAGGTCLCSSATCAPAIDDPDESAVLIFYFPPASAFITNTVFSDSAGHGVMRGWSQPGHGGPDFLPTNTFTNVAGCPQTVPRDDVGGCADITTCQ